jgi:hypothetical protein
MVELFDTPPQWGTQVRLVLALTDCSCPIVLPQRRDDTVFKLVLVWICAFKVDSACPTSWRVLKACGHMYLELHLVGQLTEDAVLAVFGQTEEAEARKKNRGRTRQCARRT